MATHILLPLDGSPFSRQAFRVAGRLFEPEKTTITVLYVAEPPESVREPAIRPYISEAYPAGVATLAPRPGVGEHPIYQQQVWDSTKAEIIVALEPDVRALTDAGYSVRLEVRFGDPAQEIADLAEEGEIDAIVLATHGRSGLQRAVLGSVAEKVLRMVRVPVVMVRGREAALPASAFAPLS
jgi:nucleotide-binding universal stress UspA family protein